MTVVREPAGLLDVPPFTVADGRGVLLLAARHGATGDLLEALLLASASAVPLATALKLFSQLRGLVGRLADVEAGLISPAEVISPWSARDLADGTAKQEAIQLCAKDVADALTRLVDGLPPAPAVNPTAAGAPAAAEVAEQFWGPS